MAGKCCPGCGEYELTWHATHCCKNCSIKGGTHGPLCARRKFNPEASEKERKAWYPGKHLKEGLGRIHMRAEELNAAKAAGAYSPPRRPLKAFAAALKGKRPLAMRTDNAVPVGQLLVTVVGGHFHSARASLIVELDGTEQRTTVATSTRPRWDAELAFAVHDPSSDLRLLLFDEESMHPERPVGRVLLPLASLCSGAPLPRPTPPRRMLLRVMPCSAQHSQSTLARYVEAAPKVPGSGMVKPKHELGTVELLLHLKFQVVFSFFERVFGPRAQSPGFLGS